MGFRFRKSKQVGPVRLTATTKGVGVSVGVPGARVGIGADGKERVTLSVPGTGLSYQTTLRRRLGGCCGLFVLSFVLLLGASACAVVAAVAH